MPKKKKTAAVSVVSQGSIENRILVIRGKKVMLDRDLAELYEVTTKALNQAVKRNIKRFPDDFMYTLTKGETKELVTICDRLAPLKHSSSTPYVFTEQGVAMLSGILNSDRAITVNVQIMRAFVRLREMLSTHADLKRKIDSMERKYDDQFKIVFDAIKKLLEPPKKSKKTIGFRGKS